MHMGSAAIAKWMDRGTDEAVLSLTELGARIRFIEVPDVYASDRRERLVSILGSVNFNEISSTNIEGVSQADSKFDIIMCSADDVGRLRAALRPPADVIIKNKISFSYSVKTSPAKRSKFLRMGFDDALYSGMSDSEIKLRLKYIINRGLSYKLGHSGLQIGEWDDFVRNHVVGRINSRETHALQLLLAGRGSAVSIKELANYDYVMGRYRTESLKVGISNLRKKLKNCSIKTSIDRGYFLILQ